MMKEEFTQINIFDFDNTITKRHTFSYAKLSHAKDKPDSYQQGIKHAQTNSKNNIPIQHNEHELAAIATYHNNPDYIAGYIAAILQKSLTFKEKIIASNESKVAINVYQVEGTSKPFLISYIPHYGSDFDKAISSLEGKNTHIELLRTVLFEYKHTSSPTVKVNFYDDSQANIHYAKELSNTSAFLVDADNTNDFSVTHSYLSKKNSDEITNTNELLFYRNGNRLISKLIIKKDQAVTEYGFYQSTGINSSYENTWFPFRGIGVYGLFVKPHRDSNYKSISSCFDPVFVRFLESKKGTAFKVVNANVPKGWTSPTDPAEVFMIRFGNTECMLLSYLIGGGYWDNPDSSCIRLFIEQHYSYELKQLSAGAEDLIRFKTPKQIQPVDADYPIINKFLNENSAPNGTDYSKTVLDYSIATKQQTDLKSKVKQIRYLCNEYKQHLDKNYLVYPDDQQLKQKIQSMEILCTLLQQDPEQTKTLTEFEQAFDQHKDKIAKSRDSTALIFLKAVLTILSLGLVSQCGLWKVKGREVQQSIEALITSNPQPALKA